jgi:NADH dehydrogenase/NADH:ubiquinone oxidoreductase subunit G
VSYASEYGVSPERFSGEKHRVEYEDVNDYIIRDPNKCVLCGLCVRVCESVVGAGALGFTERGFDATVAPALGRPLAETSCVSCGNCVAMCPTGALQERTALRKPVPLQTEKTTTACSLCNAGCEVCVETHGKLLVRATPVAGGLLCKLGRFGFDKPAEPLTDTAYGAAVGQIASRLKAPGAVIAVSPQLTNEDASAVKALAERCGAKLIVSAAEKDEALSSELVSRLAERAGVTEIEPYANLRGLESLGITRKTAEGATTLVIFGAAPAVPPPGVTFTAHCAPDPIAQADAAIPCSPYRNGTFTGFDGKALTVRAALVYPLPGYAELAAAISAAL